MHFKLTNRHVDLVVEYHHQSVNSAPTSCAVFIRRIRDEALHPNTSFNDVIPVNKTDSVFDNRLPRTTRYSKAPSFWRMFLVYAERTQRRTVQLKTADSATANAVVDR